MTYDFLPKDPEKQIAELKEVLYDRLKDVRKAEDMKCPLDDAFDDKLIDQIDLSKNNKISIFGAESGARLKKIISNQEVKITNYEYLRSNLSS